MKPLLQGLFGDLAASAAPPFYEFPRHSFDCKGVLGPVDGEAKLLFKKPRKLGSVHSATCHFVLKIEFGPERSGLGLVPVGERADIENRRMVVKLRLLGPRRAVHPKGRNHASR